MRFASRLLFLLIPGILAMLLSASSAAAQPVYTLTELSLGGTWGTAVGLNDAGQVTGRSQDAEGRGQAFVYDPRDGIRAISLGGGWSVPAAISETGQVVGHAADASGRQSAFVFGHVEYLWFPAASEPPGNVYVLSIFITDFNQSGGIIGNSFDGKNRQAFVYDPSRGIQPISCGGTTCRVLEITESGYIRGTSKTSDGESHPFLYHPSLGIRKLSLGGTSGAAVDINEAGQVVGSSENSLGEKQAFIYDPVGGIKQLSLGGGEGEASGINEAGQVIGESLNAAGERQALRSRPYSRDQRTISRRQIRKGF